MRKLLALLALSVFVASTAFGAVVINEIKVKGTEYIELYNTGPNDVDLSLWTLDDGTGPEVIPVATFITAGGYYVTFTTLGMDNSGAILELRDDNGILIDDVGYGNKGGAPIGFNSIGRTSDGWDTDDWAGDWNYADDSFFGAAAESPGAPNIQPPNALGSSLIINELDPFGVVDPGGFDAIEIYNPTGAAIDLQGYWLSDGDGFCMITASIIVPIGGEVVLTEDAVGEGMDCTGFDDIDFASTDVAYLYDPNGVRIDQLGYMGGPFLNPGESFQRCKDGMGPHNGYDYTTQLPHFGVGPNTMGLCNDYICETVPTEPASWGGVKSMYR